VSGRAILATTESYHQGWRTTGPEPVLSTLRLYGDYLGVLLEAGEYRLILTFNPSSSLYGVWLSIAGLFIAFGLAAGLGRSSGEEARLTDQLASSAGDRGPHDRRTISSGGPDIPRQ
jgi:hypothetical protein